MSCWIWLLCNCVPTKGWSPTCPSVQHQNLAPWFDWISCQVLTFTQRSRNAARIWNPPNKPVSLMNLIPKQSPSALSTKVLTVPGCSKASLNLPVFPSHAIYFIAHVCLCCHALILWSWTASSSKVQMFPAEFALNLKWNCKFQTCWI